MIVLEKRFPNAFARKAADEAVDKLSEDLSMNQFMQVWLDTYYEVAKTLPLGQRR